MTEFERGFKGVWIPSHVWLDSNLTALDKMILAEVDSLDQGDKGCYASNKYIADFCGCSETKVSKSISHLIEYGLIYVESFDGRQRILKSRLVNSARQTCKKDKADMQKVQAINIDRNIDTKIINRYRFTPPTIEEVADYCKSRKNKVDPERFVDFYTSKGWMVGKNPMKDWRAAVRTWERDDNGHAVAKKGANGVKVTGDQEDILDGIL